MDLSSLSGKLLCDTHPFHKIQQCLVNGTFGETRIPILICQKRYLLVCNCIRGMCSMHDSTGSHFYTSKYNKSPTDDKSNR